MAVVLDLKEVSLMRSYHPPLLSAVTRLDAPLEPSTSILIPRNLRPYTCTTRRKFPPATNPYFNPTPAEAAHPTIRNGRARVGLERTERRLFA